MDRRFFLKSAGIFGLSAIFPDFLYGNCIEEDMRNIHFKIKEVFSESQEQIIIDGRN